MLTPQSTRYREHTDQPQEFEEVDVGVEAVLDGLQPLGRQDAHGAADGVQATVAGEHQETLQQTQATGDVLEVQVRYPAGKLEDGRRVGGGSTETLKPDLQLSHPTGRSLESQQASGLNQHNKTKGTLSSS